MVVAAAAVVVVAAFSKIKRMEFYVGVGPLRSLLNSPLGWSSTWRALLRKIRLTLSCQNPRVQSRLFWNYPRVISTAMEAMAHGSFSSVIGGNLEVKLPTIWTDEAAEMGSREEKETEEKKSENRKAEERRSNCAKR